MYLLADGFGVGQDATDAASIAINQFVAKVCELRDRTPCRNAKQAEQMIDDGFLAASNAVQAFRDLADSSCGASLAVVCCVG